MATIVDTVKLAWKVAHMHQKRHETQTGLILRTYEDVHGLNDTVGVTMGNMARGGVDWAHRAERHLLRLGQSRSFLKNAWTTIQGRGVFFAASAIRGAASVGENAYQTQRRWLEASARITAQRDQALRLAMQQGSFTPKQMPDIHGAINAAAMKYGADYITVAQVAKHLLSQGFEKDVFTPGGSLEQMLSLLAVFGRLRRGGHEHEYEVLAAGKMLASWGQEKNAENLRNLASMSFGLRRHTPFSLQDLRHAAQEGSAMRLIGHLSPREHLALLALLLRVQSGERVPVQLRRFLMTLISAKTNPQHKRALRGLGLTPEQVDFVGEDFPTVLKLLIQAKKGVLPPGPARQAVRKSVV